MEERVPFTYDGYRMLIDTIRSHGYAITNYHDWQSASRPCILRHDIDFSLERAVELARLEKSMGVKSTYFVLLTGDFYNVFSRPSVEKLEEIAGCGHEIGLHFDETAYGSLDEKNMARKIQEEACLLRGGIRSGTGISVVSMHRPSAHLLAQNLEIPGMRNSYSELFFREFKYLSDSRRRWREDVLGCVRSGAHERLHILVHPFWYHEEERTLSETLRSFLREAPEERRRALDGNFTNLADALGEGTA